MYTQRTTSATDRRADRAAGGPGRGLQVRRHAGSDHSHRRCPPSWDACLPGGERGDPSGGETGERATPPVLMRWTYTELLSAIYRRRARLSKEPERRSIPQKFGFDNSKPRNPSKSNRCGQPDRRLRPEKSREISAAGASRPLRVLPLKSGSLLRGRWSLALSWRYHSEAIFAYCRVPLSAIAQGDRTGSQRKRAWRSRKGSPYLDPWNLINAPPRRPPRRPSPSSRASSPP